MPAPERKAAWNGTLRRKQRPDPLSPSERREFEDLVHSMFTPGYGNTPFTPEQRRRYEALCEKINKQPAKWWLA